MAVTVPLPRMPPDVPDALVASVVLFMPDVPAAPEALELPEAPDVLDVLDVPDVLLVLLLFMPVALRVASAALGEVRTTVPVSLRGTAFWLASAAVCGVTPIGVVG